MSGTLVIVESPAKARTLSRLLGRGVSVRATLGHVRDLPERRFGVTIGGRFEPKYAVIRGRARVVADLRAAARTADRIYLAPDPDREGEAIAWHVRELLKQKDDDPRFLRIAYHEITERAIRQALASPRPLDLRMVDAQQARRILDRIVGYGVSPFLSRRIAGAASAGRVQTATLRLVCDREKAIQNFKPEEYWIVGVRAAKRVEPTTPFVARLAKVDGRKPGIPDAAAVEALRRELDDRPLRVASVERRPLQRRAPPPFITSTLQQAASRACGFTPPRTMRIAQTLYEGVDLGGGPVGLITYMRTDSVAVAAEAQAAAREWIAERFGREYLPEQPNVYRSRADAQQAHEAIRPTDVRRTPEEMARHLKPEELKLYELVWRRFVASQMAPARLVQTSVEIEAVPPSVGGPTLVFRAAATAVEFPGHLAVAGDAALAAPTPGAEEEEDGEPAQTLPPLEPGEPLDRVGDWLTEQKFTQPPRRYTDASLVRAMEENGIGRPSTYAATVQLLHERRYIEREKRTIRPTALGMAVNDFLAERLPKLFDVGFTARMEERLDEVEEGRTDWQAMLREFYESYRAWMAEARGADPHPDSTSRVLDLLGRVRQWRTPAASRGRRAFDDEVFVRSLRERLDGGGALTDRQVAVLKRLAWSYRDQIPELEPLLRELGGAAPEGGSDSPADPVLAARAAALLAALDGVEFQPPRKVRGRAYDDAQFVASLRRQAEQGRALTGRQISALEGIARRYGRLPSESAADGPSAPAAEQGPAGVEEGAHAAEVRRLLEELRSVKEWRPPREARGRAWSDREFFESVERQFREKGRLTPRQVSALRRMARSYQTPLLDGAGPAGASAGDG